MTGYADAAVLNSWTELGYRTVNKPVSTTDLDRAIRYTMRGRRSGQVVAFPGARG